MFYSGIDRNNIERTGVAESFDLHTWNKYPKPVLDVSPASWDSISTARSDIKIINNNLYIFYSGKKTLFYKIGLAKLKII